jgi:hypothetical protein
MSKNKNKNTKKHTKKQEQEAENKLTHVKAKWKCMLGREEEWEERAKVNNMNMKKRERTNHWIASIRRCYA